MNTPNQNKPGLVMAIALMTLVNGIFNIIWGISLILGTFGILLICFPVSLLPLILGGFEIAYAMKMLAVPSQPVQPARNIAIFEIVAILVCNVFSMVVGILALIFYNDQIVKDYFAQLNGTQAPPPAPVEPAPALPVESTPEPVEQVEDLPYEAESPAAPKRIRKVAKK
jgi:hypothetical protein